MKFLKIYRQQNNNTIASSPTASSLIIESKDFYIKNCFRNPNPYYLTRSLTKVKLKDEPLKKTRNKAIKLQSMTNEKWKIRVKDLGQSVNYNDSTFLTLHKDKESSDMVRKISSPSKLHKTHTINIKNRKITEDKIKIKINIKDYNKKVMESNNKKHFVFYKGTAKKTLLLPTVVFTQTQREFSQTNSRLISLNKSSEIKALKVKINRFSPIVLTN